MGAEIRIAGLFVGSGSIQSDSMRWGAELAVSVLNGVENALIDNHTIVYQEGFTEDSFSGAVVSFVNFSSGEPFFGLVSGTDSSATEAVANLGLTFELPVVSAFASAPFLSDTGRFPFFWRTIASDEREGFTWAWLIKHAFGWDKIGVVGTSSLYGSGVSNSFSANCRQLGLDVVFDGRVAPGAAFEQYSGLARDVLASGANVIYFGMAAANAAVLLEAFTELGMLDSPRHVLIGSSDMMTGAENFAVFPGNRSFDAALASRMRGFLGLAVSPGESRLVSMIGNLSAAAAEPNTPYTPFAFDATLAVALAARDYYRGMRIADLLPGCAYPFDFESQPRFPSSARNISTFVAVWLHCSPGFVGATGPIIPERLEGGGGQTPTNNRMATPYALMNLQLVGGLVRNVAVGVVQENGSLNLEDGLVFPGGGTSIPVFGGGSGSGDGGGRRRSSGVLGTLGLLGVLLLALLVCFCGCLALLLICFGFALIFLLVSAAAAAAAAVVGGGAGALGVWRRRRGRASDDLAAFQDYAGEAISDGRRREFRELALGDLALDKKVGEGAFGTVYRARWREATLVAAKELPLESEEQRAALIDECNVMAQLGNHPNVVHFIGAVTALEDRAFIVTEFAAFGSLADVLRAQRVERTELRRLKWATQAAGAVAHIHAEDVVHGDIAARNFLVSKDLSLRVSDFGLASPAQAARAARAGPLRWMAPEALRGARPTRASDVWMFGCFLFELETGRIPYDHLADADITAEALERGLRPSVPPLTSALMADAMRECWQLDPERRPQVRDLERRFAKVLEQAEEGEEHHRRRGSSASKRSPTSNFVGGDDHPTEEYSTEDGAADNKPETAVYQDLFS